MSTLLQHDDEEGLLQTLDERYGNDRDWILLLAAVVMAINKPTLIKTVYARESVKLCGDDKAKLVLRIRETCIKTWPLHGFPRTINGLKMLNSAVESSTLTRIDTSPRRRLPRTDAALEEQRRKGLDFFGRTYGKVTDRVLSSLSNASHDLAECAIDLIYGVVLSEDSILGARETALIEFVSCLALGCPEQAKGHLQGARNHGSTYEAVLKAKQLTVEVCSRYGMPVDVSSMPWLPGEPAERR